MFKSDSGLLAIAKRPSIAPTDMNLDLRVLQILWASAMLTEAANIVFESTAKAVPALNIH
jgi:hypothetical protein